MSEPALALLTLSLPLLGLPLYVSLQQSQLQGFVAMAVIAISTAHKIQNNRKRQ